MKIYNIKSYNGVHITNHGYFDFVECQAKLVELTLKDNIDKIEVHFEHVKTYTKKSNDNQINKEYENV